MKAVYERDLIRGVAERWRLQYEHGGEWKPPKSSPYRFDARAIYNALSALDAETATTADVAAIIGNDSWTRLLCRECQSLVSEAVEFEVYDETLSVCRDCLRKAVAL